MASICSTWGSSRASRARCCASSTTPPTPRHGSASPSCSRRSARRARKSSTPPPPITRGDAPAALQPGETAPKPLSPLLAILDDQRRLLLKDILAAAAKGGPDAVAKAKPQGAKGTYIQRVAISSTVSNPAAPMSRRWSRVRRCPWWSSVEIPKRRVRGPTRSPC